MRINKTFLFFISFLALTISAPPPPKAQNMNKITTKTLGPFGTIKKNTKTKTKTNLLTKRLAEPILPIQNVTKTMELKDGYKVVNYKYTLIPQGLSSGQYFNGWQYFLSSEDVAYYDISANCEITNGSQKRECKANYEYKNRILELKYTGKIYSGDTLSANFKFNEKKNTPEILFIQDGITIPSDAIFCDCKIILPTGYVGLGMENNILTKETDTVYSYVGRCPTEEKRDFLRYCPKEISSTANYELYLENPSKFKNDVTFIFPRYYQGGKLRNTYYKISSSTGDNYNKDENIYNDTHYEFTIPAAGQVKASAKIETNFTNKLTDNFDIIDLPESYYKIDISDIPEEIQNKAKEIMNEKSDKQNYYKLGQFVHSYMTYDLSYTGKKLSLKEIYAAKRGVCEHYTQLYNAMLNVAGIQTLYISGWAFQKDAISGNKETIGHAWTAAKIDNKWTELDATWGLFDGISVGHIMKNFGPSYYLTSFSEGVELKPNDQYEIKVTSIVPEPKGQNDQGSGDDNENGNSNDDEEEEEGSISIMPRTKSCYTSVSFALLVFLYFFALF